MSRKTDSREPDQQHRPCGGFGDVGRDRWRCIDIITIPIDLNAVSSAWDQITQTKFQRTTVSERAPKVRPWFNCGIKAHSNKTLHVFDQPITWGIVGSWFD